MNSNNTINDFSYVNNKVSFKRYNKHGRLEYERTITGTEKWYKNGTVVKEILSNGTEIHYSVFGNLKYVLGTDGSELWYNIFGDVVRMKCSKGECYRNFFGKWKNKDVE